MISEVKAYPSILSYCVNMVLFPLKMVVPQPVVQKIPGLLSNYDIRVNLVLQQVKGKLLDIGCGDNRLVRTYQKNGGEGVGVDVYNWGDVDLIVKDTSKLPYDDHSFDTVTFVACLNHIPNRGDVLREARRLLKPDGQVVLTNLTPAISAVWHKWAFWDQDQHERGMEEGEVWGFTDVELHKLLCDGGFKVKEQSAFSWGLNHIYIAEAGADGALQEAA